MDEFLVLATAGAVAVCERRREIWREIERGLTEHRATSVSSAEGVILAGTREGIFRSRNRGHTWQAASTGLTVQHIRWLAHHPDVSGLAFAGTEPAAILVTTNGGETWHERPEVARLREAGGWYLPYSPEAGCVRGFAFHGARAYAAVEQGGLLRSDDHGITWQLVEGSTGDPRADLPKGFIHADVHSVAVHPSSPDLIFAPTGGGLYRSDDGGRTWECLYRCYCRAVWTDPHDPDHLIFGPADSVSREGRIEETRDGGRTRRLASSGLDVPWPRHMVERFLQMGDQLLAVLSNGHLIAAPLETLTWRHLLPEVEGIRAVTTIRTQ